jgi:kumamolisin
MTKPSRRAASALVASALLIAGCAAGPAPRATVVRAPGASATGHTLALPAPWPFAGTERDARNLGPVPGNMKLSALLTFRGRHAAGLNALLAKGGRVTPAQWAHAYGPEPTLVEKARRLLGRAGITSQWQAGQPFVTATAAAKTMEAFFHVAVDYFGPLHGARFYGPTKQPTAPRPIAADVLAVTGMNDFPGYVAPAIEGANGVTPSQMTSFYDMSPLRATGMDGAGVTVMFPEDAMPQAPVLAAYAKKFDLPPFDVTVVTNPAAWGTPYPPANQYYADFAQEAALDLEVVHGLAPGAREIVYEAGQPNSQAPAMFEAMVKAHPSGILSGSFYMHECEGEPGAKADAMAEDAVFTQAAAEGTSVFWASGDRGAYACLNSPDSDLDNETLSVNPDGSSPHVTSVGGTTVFLSATGAYYKEVAWGEPLEQWGSGGGYSKFFTRPSWQQAPGVGTNPARGVPDVSCDADPISGWDTFMPVQGQSAARETPVGGTSAATPCWAAITALIDEYLTVHHLKSVGFANPALYFFATTPKGLPAPAFHQITVGGNLYYSAAPGWNPATGLGTPDVAHLADDFYWYDSTHAGAK